MSDQLKFDLPENLKFGDLVVNHWASNSNPGKVLMIRKVTKSHVYCLTRAGNEIAFRIDNDLKLEKIWQYKFLHWQALLKGYQL